MKQSINLLRLSDCINMTCRSRSMIYSDIKKGLFPQPFKLGGENSRGSFFLQQEINQLILARASGYTDQQIKSMLSKAHTQRSEILQLDFNL
jgi:predicted DNA-binding transcriptional regulator AlpA